MYKIQIIPQLFRFKQAAGTSRGVYHTRQSYMLYLTNSRLKDVVGIGECAPLPQLSCDDCKDYANILRAFCNDFEQTGIVNYEALRPYPSMLFGLETALSSWNASGKWALFDTDFAQGTTGITINGLVWMGTFNEMYARISEKIAQGFHCIKLKVGAINFEEELNLIRFIRSNFDKNAIQLRLDANGGFAYSNALARLEQLAVYDIHSIEQPIKKGQWAQMKEIIAQSPIPIALDEELIGTNLLPQKNTLLDTLNPHYIVLKPSLHGGMLGTEQWISLCNERNIGTWITSALESNVGLNAIAQLTAKLYGNNISLAQGLGTGLLYTNNIASPLYIKGEKLWFDANETLQQ